MVPTIAGDAFVSSLKRSLSPLSNDHDKLPQLPELQRAKPALHEKSQLPLLHSAMLFAGGRHVLHEFPQLETELFATHVFAHRCVPSPQLGPAGSAAPGTPAPPAFACMPASAARGGEEVSPAVPPEPPPRCDWTPPLPDSLSGRTDSLLAPALPSWPLGFNGAQPIISTKAIVTLALAACCNLAPRFVGA